MESSKLNVLCDGHRLVGGIVVPPEARGLVLLLHGIPSTNPPEPDDAGYPGLARLFAEHGWAAAWVEMRAARGSPGYFSIQGWVRDARAALDAARAVEGVQGRCAIVGSSAGGCVATEVVRSGAPVDALALLAAPAAWVSFAGAPHEGVRRITEDAGMAVAPEVLEDPTEWAAEFEAVSTEAVIPHVRVPVLVLHGSADDVVPVAHAERIAERARNARLQIFEGAGHQLRRHPDAVDAVLTWLDRVIR